MASKLKNHSIFANIARRKVFPCVEDNFVGASVTVMSDGVNAVTQYPFTDSADH
jgi:hypothetical protein